MPTDIEQAQQDDQQDWFDLPQSETQPKINLQKLDELEEEILKKIEEKAELKKFETDATASLANTGDEGGIEQTLLMVCAGLIIISLPLNHYGPAILFALLTLIVSLVAGLTSPRQKISPLLNLALSGFGMLLFEYSAIYQYHTYSLSFLFWLYQIIALLFLFSTYSSMRTYRKKILEG